MADPVILRLRVSGEDHEYNLLIHPASGLLQSDIPPVLRVTDPSVGGTGVVGTNHVYAAGSNSAGLPSTAVWALDGTSTGVAAVPGTPYIPDAAANGKRLSVIELVDGFPSLTASSPEIIVVNDTSATAFPAVLTQAQLDTVIIEEITDPDDPDAGTSGGRRRGWFSGLPVYAGFSWVWSSSLTEGGIQSTSGTIIDPAGAMPVVRTNAQPVGAEIYNVLFLVRSSDQAFRNMMPASGHTGGTVAQQITLIPTVADATRGQAKIVIEGFDDASTPTAPDWPTVSTAIVDGAVAGPISIYGMTGSYSGTGSNMQKTGANCLVPVYAEFKGDLRSSVTNRVTAQIAAFLAPGTMPFAAQGPAAAREATALAFFHILRKCARWSSLPADTKTKIDALFYGIGFASCWMVRDGSASGGNKGLMGWNSGVKGSGGNISWGPPGMVLMAGAWFGYTAFDDWLNTATIASVRSLVDAAFGDTSNLYKCLNWRNEGISAAAANGYYRATASSGAPSDTDINNSVGRFIYYTVGKLTDPEKIIVPTGDNGFNKCMPTERRNFGSNPYGGVVQHTSLNGDNGGYKVGGVVRGYVYNNKASTPWLGREDCMIWELSATDNEGLRMSLPYAMWTICLCNSIFIALLMAGNLNFSSPAMVALMSRWKKANAVVKHFQANDFNSIAHASASANGGAGMTPRWSDYSNELYIPQRMFLYDTVLTKAGAV